MSPAHVRRHCVRIVRTQLWCGLPRRDEIRCSILFFFCYLCILASDSASYYGGLFSVDTFPFVSSTPSPAWLQSGELVALHSVASTCVFPGSLPVACVFDLSCSLGVLETSPGPSGFTADLLAFAVVFMLFVNVRSTVPPARARDLVTFAFVNILMPSFLEGYLLTAAEVYGLEKLGRSFVSGISPSDFFRGWLARHASGRGTLVGRFIPKLRHNRRLLYRNFHAARLVRCFLRYITVTFAPVTIAGSAAVCEFLRQRGGCSWVPNIRSSTS